MNFVNFYLLLLSLGILLNCSRNTVTGGEGNGSETIAKGIIVDSSGVPLSGVEVTLLPFNYNPITNSKIPASYRGISNSKGEYCLNNISAGNYSLEAVSSSMMKALVRNIHITGAENEVVVDTCRLCKTGTVIVNLKEKSPHCGDYLYLPGTTTYTFVTTADSISGRTLLNNVPAGTFGELFYVSITTLQVTNLIKDSLKVTSGDTVLSSYSAWKYSAKILFNTTESGANIEENLYEFPVLLRLNGTIFDFSKVKNRGEDIRFVKSDGTPLPYEIERWDRNNSKAEIWIKVDTIYGNCSSKWIAMYWGNSEAVDSSTPESVFDTAKGFQGVWHLNDLKDEQVLDATANRYNGISDDTTFPQVKEGIIGNCCWFDGTKTFIICPNTAMGKINFPMKSRYTISVWVYADTFIELPQTLVSKGMYEYFLWLNSGSWQFSEYQNGSGWDMTPQKAV
ncbi:MAG: DUF2341 domain-containing protein, partial [Chitinispirillaceae bacterium]|nr:DUF2341 domain-containing protein [Chitinispirillaceae bacterium]